MTKKQVDKLKDFVDESWDDLCREFEDVMRRNWVTEDELDEVKDYFREQFVKSIDMRIKE